MNASRFVFNSGRWRSLAAGLALLCVGVSCSTDQRMGQRGEGRSSGWSQRRISVSRDAAYDAGMYALRQRFRIAEKSPGEGMIRTYPEEYDQKGGTGRLRDAVDFENRMRRTAIVAIVDSGDGVVARCRVDVERLDTADHRTFRQAEEFDDLPNSTPVEGDAGLTPHQREAWTQIKRDRGLEREILDILARKAAGEPIDAADENRKAAGGDDTSES